MPLSIDRLDRLTLPRLPADREVRRSVTFQPEPEFFELAKHYGLNPTRLATLLALMLTRAAPKYLVLGPNGIDLESFR